MASRNLEHEIDRLSEAVGSVRSTLGALTSQVGASASNAVDEGGRRYARARRAASSAAHDVGERVHDGTSALEDTIRDYPLGSVGAAFAVGMVIAQFIRR